MTVLQFKNSFKNTVRRHMFLIFLADVARTVFHPVQQFQVWKDFFAMRRSLAFVRSKTWPCDEKKVALFVLASDMVYEAKLQGMLALGLRMKGHRVIFLTSRIAVWAHRILKSYGFSEFVYWEDFSLPHDKEKEIQDAKNDFLKETLSFQSVKKWMYRSAWIGPQILAAVSRRIMQGAPNLSNPAVRQQVLDLLPETLSTVRSAEMILDYVKPAVISLIEANYTLMGALVDLAVSRHIRVIQTVQPSRDDALFLKKLTKETRRMHPSSVSQETMHSMAGHPWTPAMENALQQEFQNRYGGTWFLQSRNQPGVKQKSKEEILLQLGLSSEKKIAVVFSPVLWDANLFYGEDLFEDFGDWFVETVRAACNNPALQWVIKMHPANLWKRAREKVTQELAEVLLIKEKIGDLPSHVKLLYPNTDISTWSLFQIADFGITVRGTIGMELPCLGVPVFTAGTGRYSGLGFTMDSRTRDEYLERLLHIQDFGKLTKEQTHLAKLHAYTAFQLRPWKMKSFRAVFNYKKRGVHPLDHNLFIAAKSWQEITAFGDLSQWGSWALESEAVDYCEGLSACP